jgi:hypothetical protein
MAFVPVQGAAEKIKRGNDVHRTSYINASSQKKVQSTYVPSLFLFVSAFLAFLGKGTSSKPREIKLSTLPKKSPGKYLLRGGIFFSMDF